MIGRIIDKFRRELWRICHPFIWGKRLQINGIPHISGLKELHLGMDVSVNDDTYLQCVGGLCIGDRVTISRNVQIYTVGLDTTNYYSNAQKKIRDHISRKVEIGEETWLCAGVIVCPGAVIPPYSIIASGSVVKGSLKDDSCIYGGVPAKKIKEIKRTIK